MRIAVLAGGSSTEREVSFMTAAEITSALNPDKYEALSITVEANDRNWIKQLMESEPDMALSALHGGIGENGAVQGLLTCLGIPYVGTKIMGSAICLNKAMSKRLMRARHIPVADDVMLWRGVSLAEMEAPINRLGFPLAVKPNQGGSSIGVSIVDNWDALKQAVLEARRYEYEVMLEKFLLGQEVTCGVIETENGLETLPALDIGPKGFFFDYDAKYIDGATPIGQTAFPAFMQAMIESVAKDVFETLDCSGYGRVDMIIHEEQLYVLEMNTLPGLTAHSLIPKAAAYAGYSFGALLDRLIDNALKDRCGTSPYG